MVKKFHIRFVTRSGTLEMLRGQSHKRRRKSPWRSWDAPKGFEAKGLRGSRMIPKVLKSSVGPIKLGLNPFHSYFQLLFPCLTPFALLSMQIKIQFWFCVHLKSWKSKVILPPFLVPFIFIRFTHKNNMSAANSRKHLTSLYHPLFVN